MANEFRFEDYPDAMTFKPVTDKAIAAFAAEQGIEFSSDYMAFLKAHNGFYFDLDTASPLADGVETFDYITYLRGLDTGFEYNDLRVFLANAGLWDKVFRAFCYPVAEGRGGDPIVEIFSGNAKGKIYFVDQDVIPEIDELADAGVDLQNADDVLAYMIHQQGCFNEVATSFSQFIAKLVVYDDNGSINVSIRRPLE
ncbi:SMI1/KNR4 family protein [Tardiphaga robiniae]|uniref:Knr4/Smi1-like domain-containing protein n=1 Tax=Tardiphaga robiniae TaxID=943830 RepID=A0A164AT16_9BRAD|nr:SMI1/KNR4 family protein [Tardiphaga robiniae]KZD25253.1 hypothetical protein A4A58_02025 [Tardiphaga robiniae]